MKRLAALALLAGLFALNPGTAQDRKGQRPADPGDAAAATKRNVFRVKYADPAALSQTLAKHFKVQADVSALPAGSGGGVLVSASPAVIAEMTQLIAQLDQKARTIEVEVVLADIPAKKGADGKDAEIDLGADPAGKVAELVKAGQATVQRVRLTATEGKPVTSTTGGSKPYAEAVVVGGGGGGPGGRGERGGGGPGGFGGGGGFGGPVQRSVSYHSVGTTVKLTASAGTDDAVALELSLQDSRLRHPEAGDEVRAVMLENNTLAATISVPRGRSVAAQTIRTEGKAGSTVSVVVVTARVVEDAAKPSRKAE